jgi:hypothetical protein
MKRYYRIVRIWRAGYWRLLSRIHYRITLDAIVRIINERAPAVGIFPQQADELINACQTALFNQLTRRLP